MLNELLNVIPKGILWAGYAYLGLLFFGILRTLLDTPYSAGDFFSENPGGTHHLARYVIFFGTMFLALKFLINVFRAESVDFVALKEELHGSLKLIQEFDVKEAAGASGVAYLLSKVTNGQILTLFGRRRS
jgi:hypothetical protein